MSNPLIPCSIASFDITLSKRLTALSNCVPPPLPLNVKLASKSSLRKLYNCVNEAFWPKSLKPLMIEEAAAASEAVFGERPPAAIAELYLPSKIFAASFKPDVERIAASPA